MERLLCIVSVMNAGGAETFLMKMLRRIDRERYMMDFCVNAEENFYREEIEALGGKIHVIPAKSKHPIGSFLALRRLVKREGYDRVIRVNEHSLSTLDLIAAKCGGAKHLAMRSSNASSPTRLSRLLHRLFFFLPRMIPTVKFAPSTEAAEYTFGKGCVKKGRASLLHNGVDLSVYRYDDTARRDVRCELSLEGKTVVGHVGRFTGQKNHGFLLRVFKEMRENCPDAVLLLVGKGEKEQEIRETAERLGIADAVILTGVRSDVPRVLSAMDVFVFPSLYEGMPNTVIEAQATGLPCVIADTITAEADVTGIVTYRSLSDAPALWAETALRVSRAPRCDTSEQMRRAGYDTDGVVQEFTRLAFLSEKRGK